MVKKFATKEEMQTFLKELPVGYEYKAIEIIYVGFFVFYREREEP